MNRCALSAINASLRYSDRPHSMPRCCRPIGLPRWLRPPFSVTIMLWNKDSRRVHGAVSRQEATHILALVRKADFKVENHVAQAATRR